MSNNKHRGNCDKQTKKTMHSGMMPSTVAKYTKRTLYIKEFRCYEVKNLL